MPNLPVWVTIKAVYEFVLAHQQQFWRLAALPMVIYASVFILIYALTDERSLFPREPSISGYFLLQHIILLIAIPFVVTWHRFVLVGPQAVERERGLRWGARELRFLGWSVVLTLIIGIAGGFAAALVIGIILMFFLASFGDPAAMDPGMLSEDVIRLLFYANLVLSFVIVAPLFRYMLFLPSISIDRGASWSEAGGWGRGNSLRLVGVFICCTMPIVIVGHALQSALGLNLLAFKGDGISVGQVFAGAAMDMVWAFLLGALGATALSLCYRVLYAFQHGQPPAPPGVGGPST